MFMKYRGAAIGCAALLASVSLAVGAGIYQNYPQVGSPGTCISTVTGAGGFNAAGNTGGGGATGQGQAASGTLCAQTLPAGPTAVTGEEYAAFDTGLQTPATVTIPISLLGGSMNRLIGGDMNTSLAQRLSTTKGIASLATLSPTAAVVSTDGWWVIAPAAGITVTMDSTAGTAVIPGQNNTKAIRIARTSSGAAGIACFGQTLDQAASLPLIGNNAVFSFYEFNGATQSATAGNFTVNIDYASAADTAATQATLGFAGGNGSLYALGDVGLLSAGPANMTRGVAGFSPGTTGTVASGVGTITGSTTWTRYAAYASIPVNIPGTTTPVTSVSVSICWTPTATTAVATDYIELDFLQLEAKPSTATPAMPVGVIAPTNFDRRPAALEATIEEYYWYYNFESQTAITTVATCENTAATAANCLIPFPVSMRLAPVVKYTAGFQAFTTTAETAVGACSALAASATYVTVPGTAGVLAQCTASVGAAGTANQLTTLGTSSATGIIVASALP